jgi:parvulin-like peptidyl-prolyl isomerase
VGKQIANPKKYIRTAHITNKQRDRIAQSSKTKLAIAVLLTCSVGVAIAAIRRPASRSEEPSIVATVDGVGIPSKLYHIYLKNGIEGLGLDATAEGGNLAKGGNKVILLKEGVISELIDRQLIVSEARREGLVASPARLQKEYSDSVTAMGGQSRFAAFLSEQGMTDEEYRDNIYQESCGQLVREALGKEVEVSEDEVRDFYDNEKNNPALAALFTEPEHVRASHILIAARPSQVAAEIQADGTVGPTELQCRVQAELKRRRERAERILASARRGASFEGLAREFSEDSATRDKGGDLGTFTRNTHTAQFDQAAFTIEPGKVSGIIETEFGYHTIKVIEHSDQHPRTLDEARAGLRELLLDRKKAAHLKEWLATLRRRADIRIDPFYRVGQLLASDQYHGG